jgi:hypothetical protein
MVAKKGTEMLNFLPSWLQTFVALAILGLFVAVASRVTGKVTQKVL